MVVPPVRIAEKTVSNQPSTIDDVMTKQQTNPSLETASFLEDFGPMLVINLAYRKDRRREFARTLKAIGLSFDHPKVQILDASRPDDAGGFPSIGCRGCFLSHLRALETAVANEWDSVIICEDDLDFAAVFPERAPALFETLGRMEWDILYPGHANLPPLEPTAESAEIVEIPPQTGVLCAHFMIVRASALPSLVEYLHKMLERPPGDPEGGPMHVDGAYSWFRKQHPDLRTLAIVPALGHQRPSRTDIRGGKWFDRVPILRTFAGMMRRALKH